MRAVLHASQQQLQSEKLNTIAKYRDEMKNAIHKVVGANLDTGCSSGKENKMWERLNRKVKTL